MLVTGGSIGIDQAGAIAFARAGYHVVGTDIGDAEVRGVVASIIAEGAGASSLPLDVRFTAQAAETVAQLFLKAA